MRLPTPCTAGLALLLASPALAAEHSLSVELGSMRNTDPAYDTFSTSDTMPSRGLRGQLAVHDRIGLFAGWHRVRRGASLSAGNSTVGTAAFLADEFTLGARVDAPVGGLLAPYISASGLLMRGVTRFDDDPTDADSPGQVSAAGLAPGGIAAGGLQLHVLPDSWRPPLGFGVHLEVGYALVARLPLADLGGMRPGGLHVRTGVSVLF